MKSILLLPVHTKKVHCATDLSRQSSNYLPFHQYMPGYQSATSMRGSVLIC
uniref:Uncharacterized protein n=1 Tax=Lepeophtheirus salmonis TaxID=72036 RepID=A0A0K2U867_LEPSM